MKKITLLLLLTLSVLGLQAQTYQLNYDSIRVGKTAGTGGTSLYGKVYLKNVGLGLVSDSILTVLNGKIRKVPNSGSTGYIQNQTGSNLAAQTAKFHITDTIKTNGKIIGESFNNVELAVKNNTSTFVGLDAGLNATSGNSVGFGENNMKDATANFISSFGLGGFNASSATGSSGFGWTVGGQSTGAYSVLGGYFTGQRNNGAFGVGLGYYSLEINESPYATGVGSQTLQFGSGLNATGIGNFSLQSSGGDYPVAIGDSTGVYNEGSYNTYLGAKSGQDFLINISNQKTFDATDISGQNITITGHGFTPIGGYVNLKYEVGSGSITGMTNGLIYSFLIVDANTLRSRCWSSCTPISTATGTGHKLTPQYVYSNSTLVGANTYSSASNRVILGDSNVTSVYAGQTGTATVTAGTFVGALTGNASTVTTNANLTGVITSVGNATSIASQTGTGTTFVVNTSPTIVTPTILALNQTGSGTLNIGANTSVKATQSIGKTLTTGFGTSDNYLQIGQGENGVGGTRLIGFGYSVTGNTNQPAYIGYVETSNSGETNGDVIIGTRSVTTDTAPTTRLTVKASGDVVSAGTLGINGTANNVNGGAVSTTTYNITNITSSNAGTTYYHRIGNYVSFSVDVVVSPTGAGASQVDFSIPVASNFTSVARVKGAISLNLTANATNYYLTSDIANDRINLIFNSVAGAALTFNISGHYEIE